MGQGSAATFNHRGANRDCSGATLADQLAACARENLKRLSAPHPSFISFDEVMMNRPQQPEHNTTAAKIKPAAAARNGAESKKSTPADSMAHSAIRAQSAAQTVAQAATQAERPISSIIATTRFSWDLCS